MSVDKPAESYKDNLPNWTLIRDVLAGSKQVKAAGRNYLPSLEGMGYSQYESYKNRAQFFNATKRTLNGLVGAVFRKPPEITLGDSAETLRDALNSCTVDQQPFTTFARKALRETIGLGRFGSLIDAPQMGGLPYFVGYNAESIVNWRLVRTVENRIIPDQIILREESVEAREDGFGSETKTIYRELILDGEGVYTQRVYYPIKGRDGRTTYEIREVIVPVIGSQTPFRFEFPFVCFGPEENTFSVQQSPILDIAELNILHYQRSAQLAHGQFYTATPTYWAVAPVQSTEAIEYRVGPDNVWLVDQPNSCGILEYRGEGLKYLEFACDRIEQQMSSLGARLVSPRQNAPGENAQAMDMRAKGETALLFEVIDNCEKGLTEALKTWVRWAGRNPKDVSVRLNRDFTGAMLEYRFWLQLDRAHKTGDIDDETYYRILYDNDVMPSNYGPDMIPVLIKRAKENRARIQQQAEAAANANANRNEI